MQTFNNQSYLLAFKEVSAKQTDVRGHILWRHVCVALLEVLMSVGTKFGLGGKNRKLETKKLVSVKNLRIFVPHSNCKAE